MGALFYSDMPDHPAFQVAKYKIGDRVKIVQVKTSDPSNYDPETLAAFNACVGRRLKIKDIMACEIDDDEVSYSISYEFHIAHLNGEPNFRAGMESVYLDDDEIAPLRKRKCQSQ